MPDVALTAVGRHFAEVRAVDGIDLAVEHGEFVTLLGPSGCGKTTTLRMVAGLERNDTGRITIGKRVVSDAEAGLFVPPDQRKLGMVFQSYAIWPHMTVFDNVAYPLSVRRVARSVQRERVRAALQLVEMERYADRPAPALSGGQQQRVAIARALVFEPEVLLLDEPLSNLDARLRTQMGEEFRALQRRLGITTLYVTHDQEEAMSLSDRIVVMQGGRILQVGSPEDVYRRPASRDVAAFFGTPNLIEATAVASRPLGNGEHEVTLEGRDWRGTSRSGRAFTAGDRVLLVIRPEDATLASADAPIDPAHLGWRGRVADVVYRGSRRSLTVATGAFSLKVDCPSGRAAAKGQDVTVIAEPADAWALGL